ncbi:hypothetical protein ABH924_003728 [Arthrobacter sp. GAS37]|uniref:hypothetical protein n=1 Tax=Arthrobacter sp. GAS37 TaxID=3156261 RepID=UPI0038341622
MTPGKEHFRELSEWAENEMELKPDSPTALRGRAAADHALAMLKQAGVDTAGAGAAAVQDTEQTSS